MLNKELFQKSIIIILAVELLSLNSFLIEKIMPISFFLILLLTLILSIKNLKYGVYIIFSELILGSLGYLFWLEIGGFKLSIRIALWLVVMLVWFIKIILNFRFPVSFNFQKIIYKNKTYLYLSLLSVTIIFAIINGLLNGNNLKNIFFDFNGWLFFSFVFPVFYIIKKNDTKKIKKDLLSVLLAASIVLSLKTVIVLYLFSHNFSFLPEIYRWIRDTRVGEITQMENGFVRVFFQSHIYIIVAYFLSNFFILKKTKLKTMFKHRAYFLVWLSSILFLSIIILGYSRSNWLGFFVGMFIFFSIYSYTKKDLRKTFSKALQFIGLSVLNIVFSFLLIIIVINIPIPSNNTQVDALSLVSDRTTNLKTEAGASSRWQLLPILTAEIKEQPILGSGFGSTVTYISNDPRVRENNPDGVYVTFAFEWGWFDIWLKLGIIGLLMYLIFIFKIIQINFKNISKNNFTLPLLLGLFTISIIHFFSPYLNHPLGIGYILMLLPYSKN